MVVRTRGEEIKARKINKGLPRSRRRWERLSSATCWRHEVGTLPYFFKVRERERGVAMPPAGLAQVRGDGTR